MHLTDFVEILAGMRVRCVLFASMSPSGARILVVLSDRDDDDDDDEDDDDDGAAVANEENMPDSAISE